MWRVFIQNHPRYGKWYARIDRQPNWVVKTAIAAAVLVVVVPLVLLTMAALVVGIAAFLVFCLIAGLIGAASRLFGGFGSSGDVATQDGDGRINVRVIRRN